MTVEERIKEVFALNDLEYERCRISAAAELGFAVGRLDKLRNRAQREEVKQTLELSSPEPWTEHVEGDALLDAITSNICRYIVLPPHAAETIALWVVHAHAVSCFHFSPRLHVTSPERRCGKSQLLSAIEALTPRPVLCENTSTPALFRLMDKYRPTVLLDEADSYLKDDEDLRGALNAGHRRGGKHVRCEGDNHQVKFFETYGAVALAGIGRLPATIEDRSIRIPMRRRAPGEHVERFRGDRVDHLHELGSMAARWVDDNQISLSVADPDVPGVLHDRAADNWRQLLAVADVAGGDWPDIARAAAVGLSGDQEDDETVRVILLRDIAAMFVGEVRVMASADICQRLAEREDRPWPEWHNGKPITQRQLAKLLGAFGIVPSSVRIGDATPKGYRLNQFTDAFARYTPDLSATPPQPVKNCEKTGNSIRHMDNGVADEKMSKPVEILACGGVADKNPPAGHNVHVGPVDGLGDDDGDTAEREAIRAVDVMPELPSFLDRRTGT